MWEEANKWESDWWGNCLDTIAEEIKQKTYSKKMGISHGLCGKSVLDVGGGPTSVLLRCSNRGKSAVLDPLNVPNWVKARYVENDISFLNIKAEEFDTDEVFDEAWIYNCLQHTENPQKICKQMRKWGKIIRIFEWVNEPISAGHIHTLTKEKLDKWLGGDGKVQKLNENYCVGEAYFGIFKGNNYEEI